MAKRSEKWLAKQELKAAKQSAKAERRKHRRKAQAVLARSQIGEQLRSLASQIETGTFVLGDKEVELPAFAELQIIYQLKRTGGNQIKVKVEWGDLTDAPLLSAE
jgi:hypothetical protein